MHGFITHISKTQHFKQFGGFCFDLFLIHSRPGTKEGKIYQRYHLDNEKLSITISNSEAGLYSNDGELIVDDLNRIWRLDVLRSLMDSVRLRKLNDGWKIEMIRLIPAIVVA